MNGLYCLQPTAIKSNNICIRAGILISLATTDPSNAFLMLVDKMTGIYKLVKVNLTTRIV